MLQTTARRAMRLSTDMYRYMPSMLSPPSLPSLRRALTLLPPQHACTSGQDGTYASDDGKTCDAPEHRYVASARVLDFSGDLWVNVFNAEVRVLPSRVWLLIQ